MNEDTLVFNAYKKLLLSNFKSGFLGQHISSDDYFVFGKNPNLLIEILKDEKAKYGSENLVIKFYEHNKDKLKDINLAKEIFSYLYNFKDIDFMVSNFDKKIFSSDLNLMKTMLSHINEDLITNYFPDLGKNEKFREMCYDNERFSLNWFSLPPPTDSLLIKKILKKDILSYKSLNDEQKNNKEYLFIILESLNQKKETMNIYGIVKNIYSVMPNILKTEKEVALRFSELGFIEQKTEVLEDSEIFKKLLINIYSKNEKSLRNIDLNKIFEFDFKIFSNIKNIEVLFEWLDYNKSTFNRNKYDTYINIHKIIKFLTKQNDYIKKEYNTKDSIWDMESIKIKKTYFPNQKSSDFFDKTIKLLYEDVKRMVLAKEIEESIKNVSVSKNKIKI